MSELTPLERALIQKLLEGDDPILATLRTQSKAAAVVKREMTGAGFYTTFSVPHSVGRLPDNLSFQFGDVVAKMPGLEHGAGFVLFVKDGALDFLEGYTYEEPWPEHLPTFELSYERDQRDLKALYAAGKRGQVK